MLSHALAAPCIAGVLPEQEVAELLAAVRSSGCDFERNGTLFSGSEAADHLSGKYGSVARRPGASAEHFIESVGTASSTSGRAYVVRCTGEAAQSSKIWLTNQLRIMRSRRARAAEAGAH